LIFEELASFPAGAAMAEKFKGVAEEKKVRVLLGLAGMGLGDTFETKASSAREADGVMVVAIFRLVLEPGDRTALEMGLGRQSQAGEHQEIQVNRVQAYPGMGFLDPLTHFLRRQGSLGFHQDFQDGLPLPSELAAFTP
jgi:hypothetical protein